MKTTQSLFKALSLASSCLFFLGVLLALLNLVVLPHDAADPNDRATAAILAIVAWTIVAASTIAELWIDTFVGRWHQHGRYGHSTVLPSKLWHWLQTASMMGGAICQGMAMKRMWDDDDVYKTDFFRKKN